MAPAVPHSVLLCKTSSLVTMKGDWFAFNLAFLPPTVAVCYLVSTVNILYVLTAGSGRNVVTERWKISSSAVFLGDLLVVCN